MTGRTISVKDVLNPGTARGGVLKLTEPLSFWGGFDPSDGRILDRSHPQAGKSVAGKVLALPGTRGSAGTPAALAESIRTGAGPLAILLSSADVNLAVGAQAAERLYGTAMPVLVVADGDFAAMETGQTADVKDGSCRILWS